MTEQQREVLKRAIKMLREEALGIQQGHTLSGNWDGEEEAKSAHDEMLAVASQLDALSHAEGEAVGEITIDKHGDAHFRASLGYLDLDQGTYELYTHPAPQVAVPEAVKERVVEAIAEALGDAKDCIRVWTAWGVGTMGPDDFLDVAGDPDRLDEIAEAAITAMFTAAPTAPAGQDHAAELCAAAEMMAGWFETAADVAGWTRENANAAWAAHTVSRAAIRRYQSGQPVPTAPAGNISQVTAYDHSIPVRTTSSDDEQPVSDPDGLTEPGRREAEQAYINCAFDYARDPIGSRDWVLFWNGWRARNAAPAPDEREIAALALERHADNLIVMAERDGRNSDRESQQTWEEAAYFAKQEAKRLRAGKEGE